MSLNQFVSILLVFCLHTSYCAVPSFGSCPSLSGISDFSVYPSQIQRREGVRLSNLNTQIVVIIISYSIRIESFYSSNVFLTRREAMLDFSFPQQIDNVRICELFCNLLCSFPVVCFLDVDICALFH